MKTKATLASLSLALGLGLVPASAQGTDPKPPADCCQAPAAHPGHGQGHEAMEARMAKQLHLTEAQQTSMKEIHAKHRPTLEAKGKALKEAHAAFAQAERKADSKVEDLKALHRTQSDLAFDLKMEHRAMRKEVRAVLTAEQAARMEGLMEGMRMGRFGMGEHGPDRMRPHHPAPGGEGAPMPPKGAPEAQD